MTLNREGEWLEQLAVARAWSSNDLEGGTKGWDLTHRCRVCVGWEHWNVKVKSPDPASAPSIFAFSPSLQGLCNLNAHYPF